MAVTNQKVEDIVKVSGASRSTVFRYLAGKPVRPAYRQAIERALAARSAFDEETAAGSGIDMIVSVSPRFERFRGYAEVLEGVLGRSSELEARVSLSTDPGLSRAGSGVLILGKSAVEEDEEASFLESKGTRFAFVNRMPERPELSYASVDCREAARELAAHLISRGRRRFAIWAESRTRVSCAKVEGCLEALSSAGLELDPALRFDFDLLGLDAAFAQAIGGARPPDAWFCLDDESAIKVMGLASHAGLGVPSDLAVVGMNDIESASHVVPALTSVRIPFRELGAAAADVVARLLTHPEERSVRILLRHELRVRSSS